MVTFLVLHFLLFGVIKVFENFKNASGNAFVSHYLNVSKGFSVACLLDLGFLLKIKRTLRWISRSLKRLKSSVYFQHFEQCYSSVSNKKTNYSTFLARFHI